MISMMGSLMQALDPWPLSYAARSFLPQSCWVCLAGGGSLRGVADANGEAGGMVNGDRELMAGVDIVYLKNVLLKFLDAATAGRFDQVSCLSTALFCMDDSSCASACQASPLFCLSLPSAAKEAMHADLCCSCPP